MKGTQRMLRDAPKSKEQRRGRWVRFFSYALLTLLLLASFSSKSHAQELLLSNLVLNNYEGKIRVRFGVEASAADVIAAFLDRGERLILRCSAGLYERRRYIWNEELLRAGCESSLFKGDDGLYHVTVPEGNAPLSGKDLTNLLRQAWGRIRIDLGEWKSLNRGGAYVIDMEMSLERDDVSSVLDKTLSIFHSEIMPAVKYQLDFTY